MNAIELLKTPFYISQMNEVVPLTTISFNSIRQYVSSLVQILDIALKTTHFMLKNLFGTNDVTFIMLLVLFIIVYNRDTQLYKKIEELDKKNQKLNNEILYLKAMERMREEAEIKYIINT